MPLKATFTDFCYDQDAFLARGNANEDGEVDVDLIAGLKSTKSKPSQENSSQLMSSSSQTRNEFELSDGWDPSWTSLLRLEEIAVDEEVSSHQILKDHRSVLECLQERMYTASNDEELWAEISGEFNKIHEGIPNLIDLCNKTSARRVEAESLTRFFLFYCELYPNQLVPGRYLPELGLVDHESLTSLRDALNQAREAEVFGRRDLRLRDILVRRLSERDSPCLSKILQDLPRAIQKTFVKEDRLTIVVDYSLYAIRTRGGIQKKKRKARRQRS